MVGEGLVVPSGMVAVSIGPDSEGEIVGVGNVMVGEGLVVVPSGMVAVSIGPDSEGEIVGVGNVMVGKRVGCDATSPGGRSE